MKRTITNTEEQYYELCPVKSDASYKVNIQINGAFTIRLILKHENKKKMLIPPFSGIAGDFVFKINCPVAGTLILENRGSGSCNTWTAADITVEEEL